MDEKTGNPMLIGKTEINVFQQSEFSEWYNSEYFGYEPDEFVLDQIKMNIDSVIFKYLWVPGVVIAEGKYQESLKY